MSDNLIFVFIILGLFLILYIVYFNGIRKAQVKVNEAMSGIDVALSKRYNVLTNSLETVKGYAKYEKGTLENLVKIRNDMSVEEKEQCASSYTTAEHKLVALAESYPDLKASDNFLQLQKSIVDCEEHLQASRRMYNANVGDLNRRIITFPGSLIASTMSHCQKEPFFQADEEEKENVKISL